MIDINKFINQAQASKFKLWLLNRALQFNIPFNAPHGICISTITNDTIAATLPYKRKNLNHLNGLHACALAAVAEFTSGISLLRKLPATQYRIIMKNLKAEYHYQAKSAANVQCQINDAWLNEKIISPLTTDDKVSVEMAVLVYDAQQNHCATISVLWQLKKWDKVKTAH